MSSDEPKFLALAEVLYLHDESLRRFGGSAGIREPGLVESSVFLKTTARYMVP
jgi:death-on-curing protein